MALNDRHPRRALTETLNLPVLRQKRGIALHDISNRTKIGVRFLEAIEAEEFEKLPGGIFSTSYLRQYADAVGLDADELVLHYQRKLELLPASGKASEDASGGSGDSGLRKVFVNFLF